MRMFVNVEQFTKTKHTLFFGKEGYGIGIGMESEENKQGNTVLSVNESRI